MDSARRRTGHPCLAPLMGYSTQYLGSFRIEPALRPAEVEYLRGYADSDRGAYSDDPYGLSMNPRAERVDRRCGRGAPDRRVARGVPGEHCDWLPSECGRFLTWRDIEKSNDARRWIPYLVDTFLRPGAMASTSGREEFSDFTFDHRVEGVIAARDGSNGRLYLLVMDDNRLYRLTVMPGVPLPYEEKPYIDMGEEWMDATDHLHRIQALAKEHGRDDTASHERVRSRLSGHA